MGFVTLSHEIITGQDLIPLPRYTEIFRVLAFFRFDEAVLAERDFKSK
jgi:hypothetical protein